MRVSCPRCEQPAGQPCVYTVHKVYGYLPDEVGLWRSQKEKTERVGKPMKVPHHERTMALDRRERRTTPPPPLARPTTGPAAIALAEREFEARERAALVSWLQNFGDLITGE